MISKALHHIKPYKNIKNKLELETKKSLQEDVAKELFFIKALSGSILIENEKNNSLALLPMDPSIKIETAVLSDGKLFISGRSIVSP